MRVTLHYKHTNHSWLRYCSKEIIGLKLVWLLERFSVPFAEIENLGTHYILRGKKKATHAFYCEVLLPSLSACNCMRVCVRCSERSRSVKTGRCRVAGLVFPSLAGPSTRSRSPFGPKERSSGPSSRDFRTQPTFLSRVKRPGWERRPLQCRFNSSPLQHASLWSGPSYRRLAGTSNTCVALTGNVSAASRHQIDLVWSAGSLLKSKCCESSIILLKFSHACSNI